jgi:hypothetical protein
MEYEYDELHLEFSSYSQLSFFDDECEHVQVFLDGNSVGYALVYTDMENDNREYIVVNNEILYLDSIQCIN